MRTAAARADDCVELYKLHCTDFAALADYYPELVDFFRDVAVVGGGAWCGSAWGRVNTRAPPLADYYLELMAFSGTWRWWEQEDACMMKVIWLSSLLAHLLHRVCCATAVPLLDFTLPYVRGDPMELPWGCANTPATTMPNILLPMCPGAPHPLCLQRHQRIRRSARSSVVSRLARRACGLAYYC